MIEKNFAKKLENLINQNIGKIAFPVSNGKSIFIKNYLIRPTANGYVVIDTTQKKQVAFTHFKKSAVAIAKNLSEGKRNTFQLLRLDNIILKNFNDAIFYKNTIKKSNDHTKKAIVRARLEIALAQTSHASQNLEEFIF
jgi:hypothetical protein